MMEWICRLFYDTTDPDTPYSRLVSLDVIANIILHAFIYSTFLYVVCHLFGYIHVLRKPQEWIPLFVGLIVFMWIGYDALRFKILAKLTNRTESIKSGHYFLENNISPNELLTLLVKGEGILYPITFIEGTTFEDNFKKIKKNNLLKQEVSYSSDDDLRKILGIHYKDLEGLFFPDTYYFYKGTPDIEILKQSYNLMMQKLNRAWS